MRWLAVAAGLCVLWSSALANESLQVTVEADAGCVGREASCPPPIGADSDILVQELPLLSPLPQLPAERSCVEPAGLAGAPASICLPRKGAQYVYWDQQRPSFGRPAPAGRTSPDDYLAPITLGAQAPFAMLAADSFLRHGMPDAAGGRGLSVLPPPERFALGVDKFVFVQYSLDGRASLSGQGFDYGTSTLGLGMARHPLGSVTLGLVGGFDSGLGGWGETEQALDFRSFRFNLISSHDVVGKRFLGGAGFTYGFDHYGPAHQSLAAQATAIGAFDGSALGAYGAAAYRFTAGELAFGPRLELRYLGLAPDRAKTRGLSGVERRARSLVGSAGLGLARSLAWWDGVVTPHLRAAIEGQALNGINGEYFTVPEVLRGLGLGREEALYGRFSGGLDLALSGGITATLDGQSSLFSGADNDSHGVFIGASIPF